MEKIDELKSLSVGDFIKISEVNGPVVSRISSSGEITKIIKEFSLLEVKTFDGTMGFIFPCKENPLEIYKLKQKPNGWDQFIQNPEKFLKKEETVVIEKTKKEQVFDLVSKNPRKKFDSLLKEAKKSIGGEEILLSTYLQLAIQKLR